MPAAQPQIGSSATAACDMLETVLRSIPGARVIRRTASPLGDPAFQVAIENGNIDAEMAVYRAKRHVYDRFPDARFEVYVI